ncbi:MAG: hypothetical protein WCT53_01885 [Candidatus Gracilibacteria bacterium]
MAPGEGPGSGQRENAGQAEQPKAPVLAGRTKLQDAQDKKSIDDLRGEFIGGSREKMEREYFGAESSDEVVRAATDRYNETDKAYQAEKMFAIAALRAAGEKLFAAKLKQMEAEGKTIAETRTQLGYLSKDFWEVVRAQQVQIKGRIPDFKENARADTMNQQELMEFRAFAQLLESLSAGEMETMISENLPITIMLQEQDKGRPIGNPDYKLLDKRDKSGQVRESYQANLDALMHFIVGDKVEVGDKEKSKVRQQGESLMWEAVVKGMNYEQKSDLVLHFCEKAKPKETQNFIQNCIVVNALSRKEVTQMQKDFPSEFAELFKSGNPGQDGGSFDSFVTGAVQTKGAFAEVVAETIKGRESQSQKSGVRTFLNFRTEGGEMLFRLGALTALINGTFDIMDAITTRIENNQSIPGAIVSGLKTAAGNKYVWGGVAAAALGSEIVYPWMKDFAYSPSGKEKDIVFARTGQKFLKEQADNHSEVMDYMVKNFEGLRGMAKVNEQNKEKGFFDLYPSDLEPPSRFALPADFAGKAGFENDTQAKAAIIQTFAVLSRTEESKGIATQTGLKGYLQRKKLYDMEALPSGPTK